MNTYITATDFARKLSDVLNRVRYRGEQFTIKRNGEPIAVLTPAAPAQGVTFGQLAEQMRAVPWPDDRFADDLEAVQTTQPRADLPIWPTS